MYIHITHTYIAFIVFRSPPFPPPAPNPFQPPVLKRGGIEVFSKESWYTANRIFKICLQNVSWVLFYVLLGLPNSCFGVCWFFKWVNRGVISPFKRVLGRYIGGLFFDISFGKLSENCSNNRLTASGRAFWFAFLFMPPKSIQESSEHDKT